MDMLCFFLRGIKHFQEFNVQVLKAWSIYLARTPSPKKTTLATRPPY